MSLQFNAVREGFISNCATIWRTWLTSSQVQREGQFKSAIVHMTTFMVPPRVLFAAMNGSFGSFSWSPWRLKVNNVYLGRNDIRYKDFVEVCSTIYHETRHAEQFYRIAQGVAAGTLKLPDMSGAQAVQAMGTGASSVKSRITAFDAAARGDDPLQKNPGAAQTVIAQRLEIPTGVAHHAYTHRDYFANYLKSSRPAWFKRPSILDEVNEWMRATYKKTYAELDGWAQGADGPYQIYRDLPEENDAHGIEDQVQAGIYLKIGKDTPQNRKKKRTDPVFAGP
jgi:hypothetical protein